MIGDGASVVLNFGNVGAGFGLGGFGAPLPAVAPALAESAPPVPAGISTVPEPGTLVLLLAEPLSGLSYGDEGANARGNAVACRLLYSNPNPVLHAPWLACRGS